MATVWLNFLTIFVTTPFNVGFMYGIERLVDPIAFVNIISLCDTSSWKEPIFLHEL